MNKQTILLILTLPFTIIQVICGAISSGIIWLVDRTWWNNHIIEEKMKQDWYPFWNWVLSEADAETYRWLDDKSEEWRKKDD